MFKRNRNVGRFYKKKKYVIKNYSYALCFIIPDPLEQNKPKFYKLNGFKENYKDCDLSLLETWISNTYLS